MNNPGYVYIMTNKNRTTLYIGVTNNLCRRIYEHKNHLNKDSFTDKYNLEYCIYFEEFPYFNLAINREKELKKWNRQKKEDLINNKNPEWNVLVTEKGFIRNAIPFSQQVNDLVKELQINEEIPSVLPQKAVVISSETRNLIEIPPVLPHKAVVISSEARNLNEIPPVLPQKAVVISSEARNLNEIRPVLPHKAVVISSEARNLSEIPPVLPHKAVVISSEARNLNEIPPVLPQKAVVISSEARNLNEIPPFSRNDSSPSVYKCESIGGEAANTLTPSLLEAACHSDQREETHYESDQREETHYESDQQEETHSESYQRHSDQREETKTLEGSSL